MKPSLQLILKLLLPALVLTNTPVLGMEKVKNFIKTKKQPGLNKKLFKLVREGNGDELEKFLVQSHVDLHAVEPDGKTALHVAAQCATPPIMELLVAKRALLDAQDIDGNTPLHLALLAKPVRKPTIECLLNKGARIDIPNALGLIPYRKSIIYTPFIWAIYNKDYVTLKRLLAQRASVNMPVSKFEVGVKYNPPIYPLDCAIRAKKCCPEMVNFLLEAGADITLCKIEFLVTWLIDNPLWPTVEMILHLVRYVPRSLIRTQWNLHAIPLLLCLQHLPQLPSDIRYLLCYYHVRDACIAKQYESARIICLQLKHTRRPKRLQPLVEQGDLINPEKLVQHYPVWYEQIRNVLALQRVTKNKSGQIQSLEHASPKHN